MYQKLLITFVAILTPCVLAAPPAQSDLSRQQLSRMKPDDRNALEQRLGITMHGLGGEGTLIAGERDDVQSFDNAVIILQQWSFRDALSARTIESLHESLQGLDHVKIIAIHAPEDFDKVQRVLERNPLPGILVLDETDTLARPLALDTRGANLIVDVKGLIRYAGIDPTQVRPLALELLKEERNLDQKPTLTFQDFVAQQALRKQLQTDLDAAWNSGDAKAAETLLQSFWLAAPAAAAPITMDLLVARNIIQRPLAIDLLKTHGSPDQIQNAIARLDERRDAPEIAILVRALGREDLEEPQQPLTPFLESRDPAIQQAALYALADSASPEVIAAFTHQMSNAPVSSNSWSSSDRERVLSAQFGIAMKLTGLRATTGREYDEWLDLYRRDRDQAKRVCERSLTDEQGNPAPVQYSSDLFRAYPMFDLTVRSKALGNQPPSEGLPQALMNAATKASQRTEPVLGKIYLPPIRVYLADDNAFSSLASNTYMGGQAEVNRVYIRLAPEKSIIRIMEHEWAHVLHAAVFEKTPRWLAEGFAESIETSDHEVSLALVRDAGLIEVVEQGLFSRLLTWQSGASSDSRESQNYAAARLGVMFLRSGPFTAGDTRLNLLFAHISNGRGERDALELAFGLSVRDLDQALRDWITRP